MKHKATYLLIKSSVLSVTDQQKPSLDGVTSAAQFKRLNDFFNDSFIKVDNPEVAIRAITAPIQNKVTGLYDDGLYPVDGIEFEVKWHNPCIGAKKCLIADEKNHNNCAQLHGNVCQKEYRVAVLIPLKQELKECESSPNGKHKFGEYIEGAYRCCFCGEPGNEAKKESWISVEDQLPENDTWVIAYSKSAFRYSGQMVVLYSDETFYGYGMPLAKSEVTHWQPTLTAPL